MWAKQFHSCCLTQTARVLGSWRSIFCLVYSKAIRLHFCFIDMKHELIGISGLIKTENNGAQRGARTHDPDPHSLPTELVGQCSQN